MSLIPGPIISDHELSQIAKIDTSIINNDDWQRLSAIDQSLTTTSNVTFAGLTDTTLTANRLVSTNGSKKLTSSDLYSWIAGTTNQITVTDDGDGTVTLSTPQDLSTTSNVTFNQLTVNDIIDTRLLQALASTDLKIKLADAAGTYRLLYKDSNSVIISSMDSNGNVHNYATTPSSSYTTGCLILDGGLGIAKNVFSNGSINAVSGVFSGNVSASTFTGSLVSVYIRVAKTSTQSINNASATPITWDTELGSHGTWNFTSGDSAITLPETGHYLITWELSWASNTTGNRQTQCMHSADGTKVYGWAEQSACQDDIHRMVSVTQLVCTAGDTITIYGRQNSGGVLNVYGDATTNRLELTVTKLSNN